MIVPTQDTVIGNTQSADIHVVDTDTLAAWQGVTVSRISQNVDSGCHVETSLSAIASFVVQ